MSPLSHLHPQQRSDARAVRRQGLNAGCSYHRGRSCPFLGGTIQQPQCTGAPSGLARPARQNGYTPITEPAKRGIPTSGHLGRSRSRHLKRVVEFHGNAWEAVARYHSATTYFDKRYQTLLADELVRGNAVPGHLQCVPAIKPPASTEGTHISRSGAHATQHGGG